MQSIPADLILDNVSVITMNKDCPRAKGIAVKDGFFIGLLDDETTTWPLTASGKRINGNGMTLIPGLIDAHCHLRAQISHDLSVQCGQSHVQNMNEIIATIRKKANQLENGAWIRAIGYDPFYLTEKRHPTRWDLDQATLQHPIRLRHITRHLSVLNSMALSIVGIGPDSSDPPGVNVERDQRGIPTGLIYGGDAWLSQHFVQAFSLKELHAGAKRLQTKLLSMGITAIQDATPTNTVFDLQFWNNCIKTGDWKIAIQLMADINQYTTLTDYYQSHITSDIHHQLEIGPVKVIMEANPDLVPSPDELKTIVLKAAQQQLPVAIHVVTPEMVWSALDAIRYVRKIVPNYKQIFRLEHLSLCPEFFISDINELNVIVVTNPSLIYDHGDRYLTDVDPSEHSWLYRMNSLLKANIPVAAGSDAPVATVDPWINIQTACSRTTKSGKAFLIDEKLSRWDALELYTTVAARSAGWDTKRGIIAPGFQADFILVDKDPLLCSLDELPKMQVQQTWIDGGLVYKKP